MSFIIQMGYLFNRNNIYYINTGVNNFANLNKELNIKLIGKNLRKVLIFSTTQFQ